MDVREVFRKLKKEAECPLCLNTINRPKTLPCLHSFCLACLDESTAIAKLNCPLCSTTFQTLEGGTLDDLPTSFHLNRLVDILAMKDGNMGTQICIRCKGSNIASCYCSVCQIFLCKTCFESHQRLQVTRGHRKVSVKNLKAQDIEELIHRPVLCTQKYHGEKSLEYYCQECKVCICHKCGLLNHSRHTMVDIQQAAAQQKMQMMDVLEQVKRKISICEKEIIRSGDLFENCKENIVDTRNSVRATVEGVIRVLKEHQTSMMSKLDDFYETQERAHAAQKKQCQFFVSQLRSSVEFGEAIVGRNIGPEILHSQRVVIARCNELLQKKTTEIYKPPRVDYVTNKEAVHNVKRIVSGRVIIRNVDASRSVVSGLVEPEVMEPEVGKITSFAVETRDSEGKQFYEEDDHVTVAIQTPNMEELDNTVVDSKNGTYTVTYTPQTIGQHDVAIAINGTPLAGSPWRVHVIRHQYEGLFKFGSRGKGPGKFDWPQDIAVSYRTGNIAVADRDNDRIQLFTAEGKYLTEFGRKGTGAERLSKPRSVAFSRSGDVIVVHSKRVSVFTESGQFLEHVISTHLKQPWSLSISCNGHVIVYDQGDLSIKLLSTDWRELQQSFAVPGCDDTLCFSVYHQEKLFVSYHSADCIMVFSKEGTFLYSIGSEGSGDGQLNYPAGLAVDKFNNLIVCDYGNGRIQVFTLDGKFISKIGGKLAGLGSPWSVDVSHDGHVVVTDLDEDCVHVFQ